MKRAIPSSCRRSGRRTRARVFRASGGRRGERQAASAPVSGPTPIWRRKATYSPATVVS